MLTRGWESLSLLSSNSSGCCVVVQQRTCGWCRLWELNGGSVIVRHTCWEPIHEHQEVLKEDMDESLPGIINMQYLMG